MAGLIGLDLGEIRLGRQQTGGMPQRQVSLQRAGRTQATGRIDDHPDRQ
jgi:hypothetical protein